MTSVKSGGIPANHIRKLRGVIEREKAAKGVLITLVKPTKPMQVEAASGGVYTSPTEVRATLFDGQPQLEGAGDGAGLGLYRQGVSACRGAGSRLGGCASSGEESKQCYFKPSRSLPQAAAPSRHYSETK